ncbi:hypothetical protein PG994_002608 [Apiospora phragmitis]|uniref:Uncharacterized protein n=1 Tax=Apiospora phragmitis TaxID=2905665 RepID=A0ABR1W8D5_9PEZI
MDRGGEPDRAHPDIRTGSHPNGCPSYMNSRGLVMALRDGGNITVSYLPSAGDWNEGGKTSNLFAMFTNGGGNVTTDKPEIDLAPIALSQDFHLYMTAKGGSRILEYEWSGTKPDSFWFTKVVL